MPSIVSNSSTRPCALSQSPRASHQSAARGTEVWRGGWSCASDALNSSLVISHTVCLTRANASGRRTSRSSLLPQFLEESLHVHLVPTFDDSSIPDRQKGRTYHRSLPARRRKAQMIAAVRRLCTPAQRNAITLGDHFIDGYMQVGKCTAELRVHGLELRRSAQHGLGLGKSMGFALLVEHLINDRRPLLVPDLLKPAPREFLVLSAHKPSRSFEVAHHTLE